MQQQFAAVMTAVASIACRSAKTNLWRQPPGGPAALFVIEARNTNIICTNRIHRSALALSPSLPAATAAINHFPNFKRYSSHFTAIIQSGCTRHPTARRFGVTEPSWRSLTGLPLINFEELISVGGRRGRR